MIPLLTYPLALLALVSLPALAAIYFLRSRYRRRTVSSLMLWRIPARIREGGAKFDRLQLPLVFFLELLILGLLACAATGPRWQLPSTVRPLILVIDNSQSMLAGTPAACPRARAARALEELFAKRRFRSVQVVLAGLSPRRASSDAETRPSLDELLAGWTCIEPAASLDAALLLASEWGGDDADLLVITDRAPGEVNLDNGRVRWWAFGRDLPNVAFVNARRTLLGDQDRYLLELANFSPHPSSPHLEVRAGSRGLDASTVELAAGETRRLTFNLAGGIGLVEATIESDALEGDNRVVLVPPERKTVRTRVTLEDNRLRDAVRQALAASGLSATAESGPELVIHQGAESLRLPGAWDLRIQTGEPATAYTGPFLVDAAHPLGAGIELEGVIWAAPTGSSAPGIPVIAAGNTVLLAASEDAFGAQHLALGLTAPLSTLTSAPDWPVLFWNLLDWRIAESPGLREPNVRLGSDVVFSTRQPSLVLASPAGTSRQIAVRSNPILLRPDQPGVHAIVTSVSTNLVAVNFLAPEESDLSTCAAGRWGQWLDEPTVRQEYGFAATVLLLAALLFLTAHLILLARSPAAV